MSMATMIQNDSILDYEGLREQTKFKHRLNVSKYKEFMLFSCINGNNKTRMTVLELKDISESNVSRKE